MDRKIKSITYLCSLAIGVAVVACSIEPIQGGDYEQLTLTAGFEDCKTSIDDASGKMSWDPGDKIGVFKGTVSPTGGYLFITANGGTLADFTGTIASGSGDIMAVYPYDKTASCDGNTLTTTLPCTQTVSDGSFAKDAALSLAKSTGTALSFQNVCGAIRLRVATEGITKVVFRGNAGEPLAGGVSLSMGETPVVNEVLAAESAITVLAPDDNGFIPGKNYYIAALPATLSSGFTATFYTSTQKASRISSKSSTIARSKISGLIEADKDLEWGPIAEKGYTTLAQPLVWKADNAAYTESHNPDFSTSGANAYSHGTGKGTVIPEGDFLARGQWVKGGDESVTYNNIFITAKEGHYAIKQIWTDDAFVFTVPVSCLTPGKALQFQTGLQGTAATPKYWAIEFSSDGQNWTIGDADKYYTSTNNGARANIELSAAKTAYLCSASTTSYSTGEKDTVWVRVRVADGALTITGKTAVTKPSTDCTVRFRPIGELVGPTISLVDTPSEGDTDIINGTVIQSGNNLCGLIKDGEGKGIANVPVSDGFHFVKTDANGVYQMVADEQCRKVYYSLPADYKIARDPKNGLPLYYSTKDLDLTKTNRRDFTLEKRSSAVNNVTILAIGDPQISEDSQVTRYSDETIAEISKQSFDGDEVVALVLGDLVNNENKIWAKIKDAMSNVMNSSYGSDPIPFYAVMGNHDLDITATTKYDAEQMFYNYFGPLDYSFNVGKVHFVCMNDIQANAKSSTGSTWNPTYELTSEQMQWLREDLAMVDNKEDKMIVLSMHVSYVNSALLSLITQFNDTHLFSAHEHLPLNKIQSGSCAKNGIPVYRHSHGAACGAFWTSGNNIDDSPIAYTIYTARDNSMYDWVYKAVGYSSDFQMRVYDGNASYTGSKGYTYSWAGGHISEDEGMDIKYNPATAGCFVASVWNSDPQYWDIELFKDGTSLGKMKSAGYVANACSCAYYCNGGHNKGTYVAAYTPHYFYLAAPGGKPADVSGWEVVATQTIPQSGVKHVYRCSTLQTDFTGFDKVPQVK